MGTEIRKNCNERWLGMQKILPSSLAVTTKEDNASTSIYKKTSATQLRISTITMLNIGKIQELFALKQDVT